MRCSPHARVAAVCITALMALPVPAVVTGQAVPIDVRLTGRLQVQFNSTSVGDDDLASPGSQPRIAATTFETRRVRLAARLTIDEWITSLIEPEYALGQLQLRHAYVNLGFDPAFELRIGQFKKAFSLVLLTSSLEIAAIERGLRIRGIEDAHALRDAAAPSPVLRRFQGDLLLGEEQHLLDVMGYMGYDLGAAAHGRLGDVEYEVGAFNGTGADSRDENDAKSWAGRLRWTPPADLPLAIGAAVSYHEVRGEAGLTDGTAIELDLELGGFRRPGLHFIGEAVAGDNPAAGERFVAAHGILSWFRPVSGRRIEGIEPVARVSWGDPDRTVAGDEGVLLTPGLSLYFPGRNRLTLNWEVFVPAGDRFETMHGLRAQAQVAF